MEALDTSMSMDYSPRAFWGTMKEKNKKILEERDETEAAFEFLLGMFEWEGLPETVRPEFLELYLLTNGMASIRKDTKGSGEYVAMICEDGATPDAYGLGEEVFSRTANGHVYEDKKDSDVVAYGWNNKCRTACLDAYRVGNYIAEIDTSLDLGVWWSRFSRLFIASDNKAKQMLQEGFAAIKKGSPLVIQSENVLREIETGKQSIEAQDLTDTGFADKLDKLAFLRECRFKWFKERYGMDTRNNGKKAQLSVDEANGDTGSAMIFPLNMLWARQQFADMINTKFGLDVSVHFAGAWLGEMERYETTVVENGEIDIDQYDAVEETNPEAEETPEEKESEVSEDAAERSEDSQE
jgi:hypothetical protein